MKKNIFNILTGILLMLVILFGSCEKWIDPEVNLSENSPSDVTLSLLLPSTQASLFYVLGGDHSRAASIFMQHQAGVDRQAAAFDVYNYNESDCNNLYSTLAATVMQNLVNMRSKSVAQNSPHFEGVANVLTAFTLGEMTDVWGDVPFYEAFQANITQNKTPKYDSQQRLYQTIDSFLVAGIAKLQEPTSLYSPTTTSDLIYRGDRVKWRRVAWTLRLRYAVHLSERAGNLNNVTSILNDPTAIFIDQNANDFQFVFGTAGAETGPRFNFNSNRGDIRAGKFLVDLMNSTTDPRLAPYFTQVGGVYVGSGPGEFRLSSSLMGTFYGARNSPVPVLTYVEYLFLVSEINFRLGGANLVASANAYNAAVTASLAKHAVTNAGWLATNAAETDATITLEKIMTAKYIALYLQSQVWSDWRRTGYPNLPVATGAVETGIPRRYPYPLNERLYNPNTPAGLTLMTRIYWDLE